MVYAPNSPGENANFWERINTSFSDNHKLPQPKVMLGDFNMVEDAIDWLPVHEKRNHFPETLRDLKQTLGLYDSWCTTFPDTKVYTFHQAAISACSRLDQIYITADLLDSSQTWEIKLTMNADHWMVLTKLSNNASPENGIGRWSVSPRVYKDIAFKKMTRRARKAAMEKIKQYKPEQRTAENTPQTIYLEFKQTIMTGARRREHTLTQVSRETQLLQNKLKALQNGPPDDRVHIQIHTLSKKLTQIEQ